MIDKQEWTRVEDELPEDDTVLINLSFFAGTQGHFEIGYYEDGAWFDQRDHELSIRDVTHWMLLPAPPEVDDE